MSAILNDFPQNKFDLSVKENFKFSLYSDLRSNERVDSWSKALAVYKSLSSKLIENGSDDLKRGVPVKIRLLPKSFSESSMRP